MGAGTRPLGADRRRREARIVPCTGTETSQIVGRYFTDAGVGFVVPDDGSKLRHSYPARRRHGRADGVRGRWLNGNVQLAVLKR
ncbi:hypothetical protein KCP76_12200 [Salmonella enterica subsp. enterica serovar Weltevreden]|nr:hypothetical protein KCP76_12200 [Salmonella enterica subsp. enterica serovar Weltevreden]